MMRFCQLSLQAQEIYYAAFSIVITVTLISLVMNITERSPKKIIIADAIMIIVEFLHLSFLYEPYVIALHSPWQKTSALSEVFYDMPVLCAWISFSVLLAASALGIIYCRLWNERNIGKTSVKEGMDKLPTGLCFYDKNGLPLLTNDAMNDICAILTGQMVMNGNALWQAVSSGEARCGNEFIKTGEMPIVKLNNGRIKSFTKRALENGVTELIAADVTTQYMLGEELKKENEKLKRINLRLVEYGDNIVV